MILYVKVHWLDGQLIIGTTTLINLRCLYAKGAHGTFGKVQIVINSKVGNSWKAKDDKLYTKGGLCIIIVD